ncbi:hypothetical protein QMU85_003662 [Photobacterium damselae]|uniref:hypothetical protein n=1 Tax=Photobacterium damselae TaxID=38293 RepID=UPI000D06C0CC|nr:hypothetical protein [Photobacterium damselae]ELV7518607.1 hypothetical protein [Photobacterium damselae]MBA5684102.1 hypothetical protein [Photobacterium damselae subsp. damselae]MBA5684111.1 hypothetical protein [Photobacterium damselae subsp. damselae]PSB77998.1 hypothetical protein C5F61_09155 [Photobacterium damselae subsp. damselae]
MRIISNSSSHIKISAHGRHYYWDKKNFKFLTAKGFRVQRGEFDSLSGLKELLGDDVYNDIVSSYQNG